MLVFKALMTSSMKDQKTLKNNITRGVFNPSQNSISIAPENVRKPKVFDVFSGYRNGSLT